MSITAKQPQPAEPATSDQREDMTAEERRQHQIELNQPLIALLQTWREEDLTSGDDSESLEEFMRGIDANRIPGSKLFEKYFS